MEAEKEKVGVEYEFEKLNVYQKSMDFVEKVYLLTRRFPAQEQYGMTAQIRRAAVSIPLNIAEGKGRYHTKIFIQFLYQARGLAYEVMTLLKISRRLDLTEKEEKDCLGDINSICAKLNNLIKAIK